KFTIVDRRRANAPQRTRGSRRSDINENPRSRRRLCPIYFESIKLLCAGHRHHRVRQRSTSIVDRRDCRVIAEGGIRWDRLRLQRLGPNIVRSVKPPKPAAAQNRSRSTGSTFQYNDVLYLCGRARQTRNSAVRLPSVLFRIASSILMPYPDAAAGG